MFDVADSAYLEDVAGSMPDPGAELTGRALRDMIRQELVRLAWEKGQDVAGAIVLNYNHHQRDMLAKITDIQHDHQDLIISTQHIHLDHNTCLEIVAVRGKADRVEALAHALKSVKGVKHGVLSISGTGREMG